MSPKKKKPGKHRHAKKAERRRASLTPAGARPKPGPASPERRKAPAAPAQPAAERVDVARAKVEKARTKAPPEMDLRTAPTEELWVLYRKEASKHGAKDG